MEADIPLFSYGTLQRRDVQLATYGRPLDGSPEALLGYRLEALPDRDPEAVRISGTKTHMVVRHTGDPADRVLGVVFILTAEERRWHEVRLCLFNAPLRMRDFDIRFDNGQHRDVAVRQRFAAGICTRNIDLPGTARDIRWIRLKYEPIARGLARPVVSRRGRRGIDPQAQKWRISALFA
jgi:hypothetical protein